MSGGAYHAWNDGASTETAIVNRPGRGRRSYASRMPESGAEVDRLLAVFLVREVHGIYH